MNIRIPRLTLFGRAVLLMTCEVLVNAVCWTIAAILFARHSGSRPVLSLGLLAWTLGLRHALDADHISAIDNATRGLINLGQLPVTCGLFFSLGHSTIVIVVTIAIAISSSVYEKMHNVGEVGGIVGAAVSGSFLFIIGLANSIILWKILKRRKQDKRRREEGKEETEEDPKGNHSLMLRVLGPVITFVNRPWKMYPVGVLFGFGFDTASSIALLGISALAKRTAGEATIPSSHIIILPFLFTAGMTLVDSADSVLMLYSYAGFPEKRLVFFREESEKSTIESKMHDAEVTETQRRVKMNVMSSLSIVLTVMSILVAFSISSITIMSLIGEQCARCVEAAEADDGQGGGLAGRWWRAWADAGEQSGYIGAGIVGVFLVMVVGYYGWRWVMNRKGSRREG